MLSSCSVAGPAGKEEVLTDYTQDESLAEEMPMWQEPQASPEKMIVRRQDTATIRGWSESAGAVS